MPVKPKLPMTNLSDFEKVLYRKVRVHPTQKPLALMKWCIQQANGDDWLQTVVDPYMGSGTTLVAAKALGLSAVGVDREEAYCELAAERLAQEVLAFA